MSTKAKEQFNYTWDGGYTPPIIKLIYQEDYKVGYPYTVLFPQTFVKDGFFLSIHMIWKWTPEAGVFIGKFFFKNLYDIQKGKWLWVLLRI